MTGAAAVAGVRVSVLDDFGGPSSPRRAGTRCLPARPPTSCSSPREWQRLWWQAFADEQLLIVLAERDGEAVALAPVFAVEGSVSLVGSGNSDYLDFLGRPDEAVLAAMLEAARETPPRTSRGSSSTISRCESPTTAMLPGLAARLGLELHREEALGAALRRPRRRRARRAADRAAQRSQGGGTDAPARRSCGCGPRRAPSSTRSSTCSSSSTQRAGERRARGASTAAARASSCARSCTRATRRLGAPDGARMARAKAAALDISVIRGATQLTWLVSRDPAIHEHSPGRVLRRARDPRGAARRASAGSTSGSARRTTSCATRAA